MFGIIPFNNFYLDLTFSHGLTLDGSLGSSSISVGHLLYILKNSKFSISLVHQRGCFPLDKMLLLIMKNIIYTVNINLFANQIIFYNVILSIFVYALKKVVAG